MIPLLRHLLQASYLYALESSPMGRWSTATPVWVGLFSLAILATWLWWRRAPLGSTERWAANLSLWSASIGMSLVLVRPGVGGPCSARIWFLSCAGMSLLAPAMYWLSRLHVLRGLAPVQDALALMLPSNEALLSSPWAAILVLAQGLGLAALVRYGGMGLWSVALALASLAGVALVCRSGLSARRFVSLIAILWAPLFLPYLTLVARLILDGGLGVDSLVYQAFPYPDPLSPWLDLRVTCTAGVAWMLLVGASMVWRSRMGGGRQPAAVSLAGALFVLGLSWFAASVARHLSHGVTGSDPFCYLQMADDLASTGSPLHAFPLVEAVRQIGLEVWPAVHVGYHPPATGILAPTVWPIGWPLLLVPFLALGGEGLALWAAPLFALVSAALTLHLMREVWQDGAAGQRRLAGALAAVVLLTSREALLRSLVPMADAAAQLLTVLTLLCLARARRTNMLVWVGLAGIALGGAYFVRHPLLPLALGVVPFLIAPWPRRRRLCHLAVFGGAALLTALPDLAYHAVVWGSLWRAESPEWFLISWRNIWPTFRAMVTQGWLRKSEFGYLWPFVALGLWRHWRAGQSRPYAASLTAGLAGVLLFALTYSALRLRDLIPIFPVLAVWAGLGMVSLWGRDRLSRASAPRRAGALLLILMALFARGAQTLDLPWRSGVWSFGYVSANQRAAYRQLAQVLPKGAVVVTSLNSGAIERYTGHLTVRPASWSLDEFQSFVRRFGQRDIPLFLLDDGEEIEGFMSREPIQDLLVPLDTYGIPTFGLGGQDYGRPAYLYQLNP